MRVYKGDRKGLDSNCGVLSSCHLGGNRLIKDIEMMLGEKSCAFWLWWRACWFCISPCIISVGTTTRKDIHTRAEGGVSKM